ncbi:HK97 family phage prohead protease/HK97 family phage major capsid protein [Bradyrhizobium ottawaense]|uniref:phage major capsid protein n=1 Tax=Bradyrhizobium ottawaense TaxID=931866 RepID=UPI003515621F
MTMIFKTVAGDGGLEFVLSDDTVDRYGDIIDAKGWVLTNFKKNPIALFGHSNGFPIGTWSNLRIDGGKLIGTLKLAARGTSARIDELISLVEQGILRAVSVGFIPIKSEPINPDRPYGPQKYTKQELLETSLVSVPANPAALALAKSLNISDETMTLAFGEQAEVRHRDVSATGEHAVSTHATKAHLNMKTLAQRIEDAQTDLTTKKDALTVLLGADELDADAIDELNQQIEKSERTLTVLKASEARIGAAAAGVVNNGVAAPAISRRPLGVGQKDVKGLELVTRGVLVRALAYVERRSIDDVLKERYPDHEATRIITKADQTLGTTTVSGWASELVQTAYGEFVQALTGYSIYPALRDKGIGLSFDQAGNVTIPGRTAGGAGGGFVGEGQPIRVGRLTTNSVSMTPKKMGVIVPFSRELAKRSTPAIEGLVRQAILEDTSAVLDPLLLDAVAGDTVRPAGLLNGVSAVATGSGGGDYQAVIEDFKALLAPFITANAADGITVIMNPIQGLNLALMPGPVGQPNWFAEIQKRINIVESTHATAGRLIALRNADFATALGEEPEFDVSEQATIHMEDTTPLEIVSGTGPTTADPVRSLWQTASIGVRMLWDISWKMRRAGMVQWINGTSW